MIEVPLVQHRQLVAEREPSSRITAERNMELINEKLRPHIPKFNLKLSALRGSKLSAQGKIAELWKIADEMGKFNAPHAACKRGCSHCCHIAVAVTEPEAKLIGKRIGRTPKAVEHNDLRKGFDYGYHNPCSFLKGNSCSIYENRPLACRTHFSLDVDALLCMLTPLPTSPVPYVNPRVFNDVLMGICMQTGIIPKIADIRAYFPRRPT